MIKKILNAAALPIVLFLCNAALAGSCSYQLILHNNTKKQLKIVSSSDYIPTALGPDDNTCTQYNRSSQCMIKKKSSREYSLNPNMDRGNGLSISTPLHPQRMWQYNFRPDDQTCTVTFSNRILGKQSAFSYAFEQEPASVTLWLCTSHDYEAHDQSCNF